MQKDILKNWLEKPLTLWRFLALLLAACAVWGVAALWPQAHPPVRPVIFVCRKPPARPVVQ